MVVSCVAAVAAAVLEAWLLRWHATDYSSHHRLLAAAAVLQLAASGANDLDVKCFHETVWIEAVPVVVVVTMCESVYIGILE